MIFRKFKPILNTRVRQNVTCSYMAIFYIDYLLRLVALFDGSGDEKVKVNALIV